MNKSQQFWERQPKESDLAWEAYQIYYQQDRKNLTAVARAVGKSKSRICQLSKKFRWDERVRAYESVLQGQADDLIMQGHEEIVREQLETIRKARKIADLALTKLLERIRADDPEVEIKPKDALALLKEGVLLERLLHGEATDRQESQIDISGLSGKEAEQILKVLDKIK